VNVIVNGTPRELPRDITVGEAVRLVSAAMSGVAVAVNDEVVTRATWESTALAEGDRVEVLTAVQGG
jgi:sulfur carrier protein